MSTASLSASSVTPVRTLLQINIAVLLGVSGTIFAFAEGMPLGAVTVPIAIIGLLFVDLRELIRINTWTTNALGALAFAATAFEIWQGSVIGRLYAFGHLLIYLSWILMLRPKTIRQFWLLCALSVLQVATSAVLTINPWLGLALIVYVTLALWTLSIFSLYRAMSRSAGVEHLAEAASGSDRQQTSISRNAVLLESAARWISPRFVGGVGVNGLLSILLGVMIFVFTPRIWTEPLSRLHQSTLPPSHAMTGASEVVRLGDMGNVLENRELVMEVSFFDRGAIKPLPLETLLEKWGDEALLSRGAVLGAYKDGVWKAIELTSSEPATRRNLSPGSSFSVQKVQLRHADTSTLFFAQGGVACLPIKGEQDIEHEIYGHTFHRSSDDRLHPGQSYAYWAYLQGPQETLDLDINRYRIYLEQMSQLPEGLEPVRRLAERITQPTGENPPAPAEAAGRLTSWLRDSGEFAYSLDTRVESGTVDPVVDFLVSRKQGHCEYFASALALLLRSADIPARYINGYKGGTYNAETEQYEVRQLHAHAWVEAYIDGAWMTLDPTPAERDEAVNALASASLFWREGIAQLKNLWMLGMLLSRDEQARMIYQPFQETATGIAKWMSETGAELTAMNLMDKEQEVSGSQGRWRTAQAAVLLGIPIVGLFLAWRWLSRRERRRRAQRQQRGGLAGPPVPFYERFLAILARGGFVREPAQTQREFAATLKSLWSRADAAADLGDMPQEMTAAFYRIRFGNHPLPLADLNSLHASLDRLEQTFGNGDGKSPGVSQTP